MSEHDTPEPVNEPSERGPVPAPTVGDDPSEHTTAPPESTGDARVDEALTRLSELDDKPVQDHAAVVEDIHRALQDTLAEEEA